MRRLDLTMIRRPTTAARVCGVTFVLATLGAAVADRGPSEPSGISHDRPPVFEANRGQATDEVKFLARAPGYTAFLTSTEAVLTLGAARPDRAVVRLRPVGANPDSRIVGEGERPGVVRYVSGGPTRAVTAPTFAGVRYVDVYPGIDLVYYGRPRGLEYDFVVASGADPAAIVLALDGSDRVAVDAGGTLVAHTASGDLRQPRPIVYQDVDGARRRVAGDYVVDATGRVRFELGAYDRSRPLVIDPALAYSTYWGGSGDESAVPFFGSSQVAVDADGNFYVAGTTTSTDFPVTPNVVQGPHGGLDIWVTKVSSTGNLIYSTDLGGPCDDVVRAIAVDGAGNLYLTGRVNGGGACFADVTAGVLVAKLDPAGAVLYAHELTSSLADSSVGQAIAVDAAGNAYVAGIANSASHDFPTTPGAFRESECANVYAFANDAFVAKLGPQGDELLYSTILCGRGDDSPVGIAVDAAGVVYVAGSTASSDFPTVNPLQATRNNGPVDVTVFVAVLSPDLSQLLFSTYLGGSSNDWLAGLAIDGQGNVYVTGSTQSLDFPTTPGALQEHAGNRICPERSCTDGFVTKIDPRTPAIVYSTLLYGELDDYFSGIAVDGAGDAHVIGTTTSMYFPIRNAFQQVSLGPADAFVAELSPDGTQLVYSSYLGGSHAGDSSQTGYDSGLSIALDAGGNPYVAGYTQSYDFPTTSIALARHLNPAVCDVFDSPCGDAFFARIDLAAPGVVPPVSVSVTPTQVPQGGTITASWAGIPIPTNTDSLQLYALGATYGDASNILSWAWTSGASDGTLTLGIPADLPNGWYEVRLLVPDPSFGNLPEVFARSEPIRVGAVTTTTIPDTTNSSCEGSTCDDGDPCTVDECVVGRGCASTPASGAASVSCTCGRPAPAACAEQSLPASVGRRRARACGLFDDASGAPASKRVKRGLTALDASIAAVSKARKKHKLSSDCASALKAELRDAKERAARLLATLGSRRPRRIQPRAM